MKNNKLFRAIIKIISRSKPLLAALGAAIALSVAFALVAPLILERIVDGLTNGEASILVQVALIYFAALAAIGVADALKEALITIFGQRLTRGLRHELREKMTRLPADYFTGNEAGAVVSRFVGDVDTVETLVASGVVGMASDIFKVSGIIIVIFTKSPGLGLALTLTAPLLFLLTRAFQKRMLDAQLENREALSRLTAQLPETLRNMRMIHTYRKERFMERRYDAAIQRGYRATERSNFYDSIYSPIIITVSAVIIALLMISAAAGGDAGGFLGLTVGGAVAVIAYVNQVFGPLESIGVEIQSIQSAVAGMRRINDFLSEPEREAADETLGCASLIARGVGLALDDVDFSYRETPVLRGFTLTLNAGERVTLVGRTGAGKSTVFKLLLGLYKPDSGRVTLCGADAVKIPDGEKRRLIGIVEQNYHIVPGSVREQLTLFDRSITREDCEKAARLVGMHETIAGLEAGYDTVCRPDLFSQGQWQLLAIARAIVADPKILLLDEITANLDADTEQKVLCALERASTDRTVLSISHRLSKHTNEKAM